MPVNVSSLQQFRLNAGLSQQEVGDLVGVTRQTIAAWERGDREISVAQLAKVAKALKVPLTLLLSDTEDEVPELLFRADDPSVLSTELKALLSRKSEDYAQIELLAGESPILPETRPLAEVDTGLIERVAQGTRDWLGVDDAPIGDVLALFESKGLKVICHPLPKEVSGFSAYTDDWGGVIVINDGHPLERQYFTALHELAHLIFHRKEYDHRNPPASTRGDPREKAANYFASAVLLPPNIMESEFKGYHLKWIPEAILSDMKLRYKVSMRTVLMRAAALGLISTQRMGQQLGVLNKKYGPEDEPVALQKSDAKAQSSLERLTYRALVKERITTTRAAEVPSTPLSRVRERLADYLTEPA